MHIEKVDHIRKATGMAYDHLHLPTAIAFLSALPLHLHFCPPYDYNFISVSPTTTPSFLSALRLQLHFCSPYDYTPSFCKADEAYSRTVFNLLQKL